MLHVAVEELEIVAEGELGEDLAENIRMNVDVSVAVECLARKGVRRGGHRQLLFCPGRWSRGRPSRCSPVMLRWTFEAPPAIAAASENMYCDTQRPGVRGRLLITTSSESGSRSPWSGIRSSAAFTIIC